MQSGDDAIHRRRLLASFGGMYTAPGSLFVDGVKIRDFDAGPIDGASGSAAVHELHLGELSAGIHSAWVRPHAYPIC